MNEPMKIYWPDCWSGYVVSAIFLLAAFPIWLFGDEWGGKVIVVLLPLLIISPIRFVTVDRDRRVVAVTKWFPLKLFERRIPVEDIEYIKLTQERTRSRKLYYKMELVLKSEWVFGWKSKVLISVQIFPQEVEFIRKELADSFGIPTVGYVVPSD